MDKDWWRFKKLENSLIDFGLSNSVKIIYEELKKGIDITDENKEDILETEIGIFLTSEGSLIPLIIYIPETIRDLSDDLEKFHKYHIVNCKTIESSIRGEWREKYKATNRTDGFFEYYFINYKKKVKKQKLFPCKNCIKLINQKINRDYKRDNFNFSEFLKSQEEIFINDFSDSYTDDSNRNVYSDDWKKISQKIREQYKNMCRGNSCPVRNETLKKGELHVHHKDMRKDNNSCYNLIPLCLYCHANQPNHYHMKNVNYRKFCNKYSIKY